MGVNTVNNFLLRRLSELPSCKYVNGFFCGGKNIGIAFLFRASKAV